jgi:uncharacterized glyoxalase superfamily protein PhnB
VKQTIFPALRYVDAHAAIAWLEKAFGAERHVVYEAGDGSVAHAQLRIAGNLILLGNTSDDDYPVRSPKQGSAPTMSLYVVLPDANAVDALHARAVAAGAPVIQAPYDTDYGSHDVRLLDVEGTPWTFGTYDPESA